jgi:hypothetical protein
MKHFAKDVRASKNIVSFLSKKRKRKKMYSNLHCHLVYSAFSPQRVRYRQNCNSLSGDVSIGPESIAWQATASRSPSQDVCHWDRQAAVICKNCRQARSLKHNPLHLIERKIIPPPIIEPLGARGGRVRHGTAFSSTPPFLR